MTELMGKTPKIFPQAECRLEVWKEVKEKIAIGGICPPKEEAPLFQLNPNLK